MFEQFTQGAREAVKTAQRVAAAQGAEEVRPLHLLIAVLEKEGGAWTVLRELGADPAALRDTLVAGAGRYPAGLNADDADALRTLGIDLEEVSARLAADAATPSRAGLPAMSRGTKKVLELSLREALQLGHNWIGTEHFLLAMDRARDRTVLDALADSGVTLSALRRAISERTREAG